MPRSKNTVKVYRRGPNGPLRQEVDSDRVPSDSLRVITGARSRKEKARRPTFRGVVIRPPLTQVQGGRR